MSAPCHRVCITPTKNETWVIKPFLAAAKLWASHIVVADQGSTDGTLDQLRTTAGVDVVLNESPTFDELHRQRLLLGKARQIEGKRILIALDADEALSANFPNSKEWERLSAASPGTTLRFRWVNILPGFKTAWIPPTPLLCGFVDDGSAHNGIRIHNPRVPSPPGAPVIDVEEVVVLHFQYVAPVRTISKHRWYQVWEHMNDPQKGPLAIFRQYNHMHGSWGESEIHPIKPEWLEGYDLAGIDFRSLAAEPMTWWDREVAQILYEKGPERFRRLAIWDKDWNAVAEKIGLKGRDLSDPRSLAEKVAHHMLRRTQPNRSNWGTRVLERLLRVTGW